MYIKFEILYTCVRMENEAVVDYLAFNLILSLWSCIL